MEQESIKILCYADDAILMADKEDDLQLLYRFQTKKREIRCKLDVNAPRPSGYPKDLIRRNKYMSAQSKLHIHRTAATPVLTYAVEARADITGAKNMRSAEMKTFGAIKRRNHVDRMTEGRWTKWAKDERPNSRAGHLLPKTLSNIKKSRRNKIKS
ncbi:hypothetical protein Trydic_g11568 [Trypoxylus dichotomus]